MSKIDLARICQALSSRKTTSRPIAARNPRQPTQISPPSYNQRIGYYPWRINPKLAEHVPKELQNVNPRSDSQAMLSLNQRLFEIIRDPKVKQDVKDYSLAASTAVMKWACNNEINVTKNETDTRLDSLDQITKMIFEDLIGDDLALPGNFATRFKTNLMTDFICESFCINHFNYNTAVRFNAYQSYIEKIKQKYSTPDLSTTTTKARKALLNAICVDCINVASDASQPDWWWDYREFNYYSQLLQYAGISLCTTPEHLAKLLTYSHQVLFSNVYTKLSDLEEKLNKLRLDMDHCTAEGEILNAYIFDTDNCDHTDKSSDYSFDIEAQRRRVDKTINDYIFDLDDCNHDEKTNATHIDHYNDTIECLNAYIHLISHTFRWLPDRNMFAYPVYKELTDILCAQPDNIALNSHMQDQAFYLDILKNSLLISLCLYIGQAKQIKATDDLQPKNIEFLKFEELVQRLQALSEVLDKFTISDTRTKPRPRH